MKINKNMKKEIKARVLVPLLLFAILLISVSYVSAYQRLCLGYGEGIPGDDYICWHTRCIVCVTDDFHPTHPNYCADITGCSALGDGTVDVTPPELTVNSPVEGEVYPSRKVLFDIESNEPASFYYLDNIFGRNKWKRLASNVNEISKGISQKDGFKDITIKAVDRNGNAAFYDVQFYVDSRAPKIKKSYPKKGFANGDFSVEFVEENPVSLFLHYGNSGTGYRSAELDVGTDCYDGGRGKYYCETGVVLDDYNQQDIEYWFELTDLAGTAVESKKRITLSVDTSAPDLLNPDDFWEQGSGRKNKYIYFYLEIDEPNLDEVSYIDWNDRRPRWRKLCSRLKDGHCIKKKSFKKGWHDVDVQVLDEAGNAVGYSLDDFEVV